MSAYGTITKPCGGGGSSIFAPGFASRLLLDIFTELDTHAKNCARSPAESVFIRRTHSVISLSTDVSAHEPAAQAIIFAGSAYLTRKLKRFIIMRFCRC